jgi:hypothetical protein
MAQIRVNSVRQDYLVPFAGDGFSRVTGLDKDSFAAKMTINGTNVVLDLIDDVGSDPAAGELMVKEVGVEGTYVVAYLPDTVGELLMAVEYTAGSLRFAVEHDVVQQTTTDAAASEKILIKSQYPNGSAAPYCSYDIKTAAGTRVRTGFTDKDGSAELFLEAADNYVAQVNKVDLQFATKTFDVDAGANADLVVKGKTPSVTPVAG